MILEDVLLASDDVLDTSVVLIPWRGIPAPLPANGRELAGGAEGRAWRRRGDVLAGFMRREARSIFCLFELLNICGASNWWGALQLIQPKWQVDDVRPAAAAHPVRLLREPAEYVHSWLCPTYLTRRLRSDGGPQRKCHVRRILEY